MVKIVCSFIIHSFDCSPERVTEYLGIQPDKVRRIGERIPAIYRREDIIMDYNDWDLFTKKTDSPHIGDYISELIGILMPCQNKLLNVKSSLGSETKMKILVAADTGLDEAYPGTFIDYKLMKFLGELCIDLDIDFY